MKLEFNKLVTLLVAFSVFTASCYLFGFWGSFGINIFVFTNISEIIKLSIYPFSISCVALFLGHVGSDILWPKLEPGGGADSPIGRFGFKYWRLLMMFIIVLVLVAILTGPEPGKWFIASFMLVSITPSLTHISYFCNLVPDNYLRGRLAIYLVMLPTLAFSVGRKDAHAIKTGAPETTIDVARSSLSLNADASFPVAYLGFVGGHYVMYESISKQVIFVKEKDGQPFHLIHKKMERP